MITRRVGWAAGGKEGAGLPGGGGRRMVQIQEETLSGQVLWPLTVFPGPVLRIAPLPEGEGESYRL